MSSSGVHADSVSEALDALAAALNIEMPIAMLESGEQNAAAERYEALLRRAHFRAVGIVKALDDSRAAAHVGATSTSTLLQHRLRLSPAEAGARVRAARALCPGQTLTGEPIPPQLPVVAEAAEQGQISGTHVDVIDHPRPAR